VGRRADRDVTAPTSARSPPSWLRPPDLP
jgi:hypothetical protein